MAVASVASVTTAGGVTLSAVNSSRRNLIITNTDANALYVLLGEGTVTSSFYSFKLDQDEDAWIPGCTELVKGLWAGDGSGAALITTY